MNKHLAGMCHIALWAFLFLSPLTYWRGTGFNGLHYLMTCMQPLFLMIVFYLNYLVLAPKFFVEGKHRYDLLINVVLLTVLGVTLHYWMQYTNEIFNTHVTRRTYDLLGTVSYIVRDSLNLAVFAAGATALALARQWVTTDQKLKETEAARAQAELKNLRNQINPHFLLNTLNNIYALTAISAERAQEAIMELSKMLRHMLYEYQEPTVALKEEVDFIRNYVSLMKLRMPASVDVVFEVNCKSCDLRISPMLIISLVENAFKHGISPTEPSFVHIKVFIDKAKREVTFDIRNSNFPKTEQDRSGHGIGLQQVERRLQLLYPGKHIWEKGLTDDGKTYFSKITIDTNT
jgi:sensor histidine kinase YesM